MEGHSEMKPRGGTRLHIHVITYWFISMPASEF